MNRAFNSISLKATFRALLAGAGFVPFSWADRIEIERDEDRIQVLPTSEPGYLYQLQKSIDLSSWSNLGDPRTGSGDERFSFEIEPTPSSIAFYRVARSTNYGTPEDWIAGSIGEARVSPNELSIEASSYYTIIAAKAFAYFTGTLEQAYHEPVGEVANYFGFADLRDEIRERGGPGADQGLRGASWIEVLEILNAEQRQVLYDLMSVHEPYFVGFFATRLDLLDALWAARGNGKMDTRQVLAFGEKIGRDEAELTVTSAQAYGAITATLTVDQIEDFENIRSGVTSIEDMAIPGPNTAVVNAEIAAFSTTQTDLMTAIGSKLLPWVTGTVDDAVVLPPGKISNYFGFAYYRYIDRANVSRSDAASKFLSVLTEEQSSIIATLAQSIVPLSNAYIDGRETLIRDSYPLKFGNPVDRQALISAYASTAGIGETQRAIVEMLTFNELETQFTPEQFSELSSYRTATIE